MLAVISIVFLLMFVFKIKKPGILVGVILVLVVAGGLSLSLIQGYFGTQYYHQKLDTGLYTTVKLTKNQLPSIDKILKDYKKIDFPQEQCKTAYEKNYRLNADGAWSDIKVDFLEFRSKASADEYFKVSQLFYETKNTFYVPEDIKLSYKKENSNYNYFTSLIRSDYSSPNDLIYVKSKINYISDLMIQNGNLVVVMTEKSNKPKTQKAAVFSDIKSLIAKSGIK